MLLKPRNFNAENHPTRLSMTSAFKKKKEPTNISHHRAVAIPDYNQSFHKDICNIIWSDNIGKLEILEFNSSKT